MRWANPPVAWMMHAGIGRMLAAGLTFPAHRHAPRGSGRIALEAYPGFTARRVCRTSYKSDTAAKQTPDRRANRRAILAALERGTASLDIALTISPTWRRRLIADGSGDLLDAVICALQAAHAAALPRYGLPRHLDPLEGWIASVPAYISIS
jgi:predicted RNase H-like nuclease